VGKIEETLRHEIARLARKEIRAAIGPLSRRVLELKRSVSGLRKSVEAMGVGAQRSSHILSAREALPKVPGAKVSAARVSGRTIKNLRARLGLTQTSLAVLVGVTPAAVQLWEQGRSMPRGQNKAALVAVGTLGRREVKRILADKGMAPSKRRLSVPPRRGGTAKAKKTVRRRKKK